MKYIYRTKIKPKGGIYFRRVEIWTASRGGSKSPTAYYLKYRNRWITPFEQRVRGWVLPVLGIFLRELYYRELMEQIIYKENPFLKLIPKDNNKFGGAYISVPLVYGA